jgi:hypothetical protein
MLQYYVLVKGDAFLDADAIQGLAQSKRGVLTAIDMIDLGDLLNRMTHLPPKAAGEERDYLFLIEAADQESAQWAAKDILEMAGEEWDEPI